MTPLDPSAFGQVTGLAFDIDDTLTTHGALTPPAYSALARLREAGFGLVAVTGRPLGWTDAFASSWPVDVAVGENGAGWARREGRGLSLGYFEDGPTRSDQQRRLQDLRTGVARALPHIREASDQPARRCDLAFDVGEAESVTGDALAELVGMIEAAGMRAPVSSVHAHAVPGHWDKASGVVRALGTDREQIRRSWMFVGDSGNDAAAFSFFEHTVGVANVIEHLDKLPTHPRWITAAARGEGFVELADALLDSRRAP